MTLDELVARLSNQFCEVAGSDNAKNQCVDLANAYIRDVLGMPIVEWANAVDFPSRVGPRYEYILNVVNDPNIHPIKGDIVIWGKPFGKYTDNAGKVQYAGHIAVCLSADGNKITSFDQNFPTGTKCHTQDHDYTGVVGWLRLKGGTVMQIENKLYELLVNKSTERDAIRAYVGVDPNPLDDKGTKVKESIDGIRNLATGLQRQLTEAQTEIRNREEQVQRIQQTSEATAKTQQSRIDALEAGQKAFDTERDYLKNQIDAFARDKGETSIELERTKTLLKQEQSKSCTTLTLGDVVVLLWDKLKDFKLK